MRYQTPAINCFSQKATSVKAADVALSVASHLSMINSKKVEECNPWKCRREPDLRDACLTNDLSHYYPHVQMREELPAQMGSGTLLGLLRSWDYGKI